MKILVTPRSFGKHDDAPFRLLEAKGAEITRNETGGIMAEETLKAAIAGAEGVIVGVDPLTREVMSNAPGLRAVAKYGVGTDNIDLDYCEEKGIKVSITAGANSDAVADYTFALMLALARKVITIDAQCRRRDWAKITTSDVAGRTLGLIGLGAIGKGVAARAKGFGMRVLAYRRHWDEAYAAEAGVEYATVEEICKSCDFISLHTPLTDETRNIIGKRELGLMKPGAFLVNTARGGLIDEEALLAALEGRAIGGAGLDVFAAEPPDDGRWYALDNVVLGSHCGASTEGAAANMGLMSAKNLLRDLGLDYAPAKEPTLAHPHGAEQPAGLDCSPATAPAHADETDRKHQQRHCERSEAIQEGLETLDCFVAKAPRNDGLAPAPGPTLSHPHGAEQPTGLDCVPATAPTLYFIGVTTGKSSIMGLFPKWAEKLGLGDVRIKGIDLPIHAPAEDYRRAVQFLKDDPLSLGALVTTHKLDLFEACEDLFDYIDPFAKRLRETSCLSKGRRDASGRGDASWLGDSGNSDRENPGRGDASGSDPRPFNAHAKDPISSGLALEHFVAENFWKDHGGEVLIFGAGGSALAMTLYLGREEWGDNVPKRITIANRSTPRLESAKATLAGLNPGIDLRFVYSSAPQDNDRLVAALPPYSLIVNATGLGKDAPGSPTTDAVEYPEHSLVWEINYRGELLFMEQAKKQAAAKSLHVEDGWTYFIHGWTQVIAEVFDLKIDGALLEELSRIAREV